MKKQRARKSPRKLRQWGGLENKKSNNIITITKTHHIKKNKRDAIPIHFFASLAKNYFNKKKGKELPLEILEVLLCTHRTGPPFEKSERTGVGVYFLSAPHRYKKRRNHERTRDDR